MNNLYPNTQNEPNPIVQLGALALGIYALNKLFSTGHDTVNYTLWHRKTLVYHGICYADRVEKRLDEHERNGLYFDEYDHDHAKPRENAAKLEKRLIQRDKPKYNYQHNY